MQGTYKTRSFIPYNTSKVNFNRGIKFESWTGKWGSSLIGGLESGGDQAFKTDKSKKCKSASNTSFYLRWTSIGSTWQESDFPSHGD
jgi:hypothetical protein